MTDKNRNFRSSYYDKVGFRGVEEKKSLEILINEKPMDRAKLSKFCMRFTLPSIYRELVWKVLLDVVSVYNETHEYIMNKHSEQYVFMEESLKIMQKMDKATPKSIVHTLMFLMTENVLLFDQNQQFDSLEVKNLIAISSVFLKFCSCEVTSYWLFKKFVIYQQRFNLNIKSLKEQLEAILKKEDISLYEHLKQINALDILPVDIWFGRYFAEILHHTSLMALGLKNTSLICKRIFSKHQMALVFDKVIGGSYKILPYIGSAILMIVRHLLLVLNSSDKIMEVLEKIPEDTSDLIVSKAFDLYYS